jgi:hypothetical protein
MARGHRRKCKCCRRLFRPDPRNLRHQRYCSELFCREARKAASQARWLARPENQDYFRGPVHLARSKDLLPWEVAVCSVFGMLLVVSAFECREVAGLKEGSCGGSRCAAETCSPYWTIGRARRWIARLHFGTGTRMCGEHAALSGRWLGEARHGRVSGFDNMAFALRGFTPPERRRGFSGLQFTSVSRWCH